MPGRFLGLHGIILCLLLQILMVNALIHNLQIRKDDREIFVVETFGFFKGGVLNISVSHMRVQHKLDRYGFRRLTHESLQSRSQRLLSDQNKTEIKPTVPNKNSTAPVKAPAKKTSTTPPKAAASAPIVKLGFVLRRADTESGAQEDLEEVIGDDKCLLDPANLHPEHGDVAFDMSSNTTWRHFQRAHVISVPGLYSLVFVRCRPKAAATYVRFDLEAHLYNPGPNYLSAGDVPLPHLYFGFFVLFSVALCVWVFMLLQKGPPDTGAASASTRTAASTKTTLPLHYLMCVCIVLKCLTLLTESMRYAFVAKGGLVEGMWEDMYLFFASIKGIMLFTVILLIGSGWSLMKPFLSENEKRIIFVVLTLQVINNVAYVVIEETAPGSQSWLEWRDLLHLVDMACCCAILFPIMWSINHLKKITGQTQSDDSAKASKNLAKLQLFRRFYIMVLGYVYFTRIVVVILTATVSYDHEWWGDLATEAATLLFYVTTGYAFRPTTANPNIKTQDDEDDDTNNDQESGRAGTGEHEHNSLLINKPYIPASRGYLSKGSETLSATNNQMEYGLEAADEFADAGISLVPQGHAR